jgi:hypothetical protein
VHKKKLIKTVYDDGSALKTSEKYFRTNDGLKVITSAVRFIGRGTSRKNRKRQKTFLNDHDGLWEKLVAPCLYPPPPILKFKTKIMPFVYASFVLVCALNPVVYAQLPEEYNFKSWGIICTQADNGNAMFEIYSWTLFKHAELEFSKHMIPHCARNEADEKISNRDEVTIHEIQSALVRCQNLLKHKQSNI